MNEKRGGLYLEMGEKEKGRRDEDEREGGDGGMGDDWRGKEAMSSSAGNARWDGGDEGGNGNL